MTAFDNIKTNNWPATSNNLEDFLVLKMPLNDLDSLTGSLPVVAGSKELFPKRTLTNVQARTQYARVQPNYGATGFTKSTNWRTDYANPENGIFNGDGTSTQAAVAGDNAEHWFAFATPLTNVTKVETRMGHDGNQSARAYMGNGTTSYVSSTAHAAYFTVYSGAATTFSKMGWRSNNGSGASVYDIRITDDTGTYVLITNQNLKKHYDNNVYFDSNAYLQLAAADSVFDLGTDDFCIEYYFKADNLSSAYKLFQLGTEINWTENIEMQMNTNGTIVYSVYPGGSVATDNYGFTGTQTFTAGTWNHVAFTRQGSTFRGFLNGVADGSVTYAGTISSPTPAHHRPTFGARTNGSVTTIQGPRLVGSIQDFRLYKGTAKYTSTFTPPGAILG